MVPAMNTEQVSVTWFQTAKSRLNNQNWTVSAWRGLLVARVSVVSEGLLDGGEQMGSSLVRAKVLPIQTGKRMKEWREPARTRRAINFNLSVEAHKTT